MRKGLVLVLTAVSVFFMGAMSVTHAMQQQAVPAVSTAQVLADDEAVDGVIPQDAIRLRIIANSDKPEDQQLKRDVRDQIIAAVAVDIRGAKTADEARAKIRSAVPEMNEIAQKVIAQKGYHYGVKTDFGQVPFPTKLYGDHVYPAGNYEALRIQIGQAAGQNWWCVLFPPLCFVDMANGDAVAKPKDMPEHAPVTTVAVKDASQGVEKKVEVRFALFDKISELFHRWFA